MLEGCLGVLFRIFILGFWWTLISAFRWIVQYLIALFRFAWYGIEFLCQIPQQGFLKAEFQLRTRYHLLLNQELAAMYLTCRYRPWRLVPLLILVMFVTLLLIADEGRRNESPAEFDKAPDKVAFFTDPELSSSLIVRR